MQRFIPVLATLTLFAVAFVALDSDPPERQQARQPQSTQSVFDAIGGLTQRLGTDLVRLVECPSDMPDCSRTARQRYRKWKRGGYGYTKAWRLHYGKTIKRQILRKARTKWLRNHNSFPRRRLWREYRTGKRFCVANQSFWYFDDPNPGNYCEQRWYKDPKRRFVKNVFICAGEIGLTIIGSKSAPRKARATVVGGTGYLCTWDKMP